jgi:hypothetical protein
MEGDSDDEGEDDGVIQLIELSYFNFLNSILQTAELCNGAACACSL